MSRDEEETQEEEISECMICEKEYADNQLYTWEDNKGDTVTMCEKCILSKYTPKPIIKEVIKEVPVEKETIRYVGFSEPIL